MQPLKKATLIAVEKGSSSPLNGASEISVQFNPASLHVTLASVSDSGKDAGPAG